jgi:hypothetical protein
LSSTYDVFISYTRGRDLHFARRLARELTERGFRVWFDEAVLARKTSWVPQSKTALMAVFREAIEASECLLLYAMEAQAIPPVPGFDEEKAIANHEAMRNELGHVIAWNWQQFEFWCARDRVVIRGGSGAAVAEVLRRRGIVPRNPVSSVQPGRLQRLTAWLTRRRRMAELFRLLHSNPDEPRLRGPDVRRLLGMLNRGDPRLVVLAGGRGSGRTTLIEATFALAALENVCAVRASLPPLPDLPAWVRQALRSAPANSLLAIDDFGDQIAGCIASELDAYLTALGQLRLHFSALLLVLTDDQANEFVEAEHGTPMLLDRVFVKVHRLDPIDRAAIGFEARKTIEDLGAQYGFDPEQTRQIWHFLSRIPEIPVRVDLHPFNFKTLQGTLLEEPGKSLRVLERVLGRLEKARSSGDWDALVDESVRLTWAEITGFSPTLFVRVWNHETRLVRRAVAEEIGKRVGVNVEDIQTLIDRLDNPFGAPSPALAQVDAAEIRHELARVLAEELLGSRHAVLTLNYTRIVEFMRYDPRPTEALHWVLRSIQRFPWRVLVVEGLESAPRPDAALLSHLLEPTHGENELRHCLVVIDRLPDPGIRAVRCRFG